MRRHKDDILPKPNMASIVPEAVLSCRKCGKKDNVVMFRSTALKLLGQRATFNVIAHCVHCGREADAVGISVIFMGKGSWQVLKSHVG